MLLIACIVVEFFSNLLDANLILRFVRFADLAENAI